MSLTVSGLEQLRARFRERLIVEAKELEHLSGQLDVPATFALIEDRAHKLAGLAGSLEFHQISDLAAKLDRPAADLEKDALGTRKLLTLLVTQILHDIA